MKIRKIVYLLLAVILVVTCIGSGFFREVESVEAATRLNGIQQIVDEISTEEPFVILELVPDEAYASLGAYVLGEEPTIDARLLADCLTEASRREKVKALLKGIIPNKITDTLGTPYPMNFEGASPYQETISKPSDMTGWNLITFAPVTDEEGNTTYHTEERKGYYEPVGEGEIGDYSIVSEYESENGGAFEEGSEVTPTPEPTVEPEATPTPEPEEEYVYTPGEGTHRWVDGIGDKTYEVAFVELYYRVNVTSNDWFSKKVFEWEQEKRVKNSIKVITLTPSQLEENITQGYLAQIDADMAVRDWSDVDMLYLSNSSCFNLTESDRALLNSYVITDEDGKYINDVSSQVAYIIYEYVFNTSLPVIVDSEIVSLGLGLSDDSTNLQKLAYLLWDYTTDMKPNSYKVGEDIIDLGTWDTEWPTGLTELLLTNTAGKPFAAYGSVQGSVYFNNFNNIVDAGFATMFGSVSMDDVTSDGKYDEQEALLTGISAVVNEIESENFFNKINEIGFTTEYNTKDNRIEISQSTVVKYILNYSNRRQLLYKDTIKVLDIEPSRYSTLTETKIRGWLKAADAARIKKIEINQVTTSEFIGMLTDLTAEYDMIYFGGVLGPNKQVGAINRDTNTETVFNDTSMNGLVYFHVGDQFKSLAKYKGMLDTEYTTTAKTKYTTGDLVTRFSGRDITKDKLQELKEYVDAGYPVMLANKFVATDSEGKMIVDAKRVDNCSYMYEFFDYALGKENVMSEGTKNSYLLANYLNMSRLYVSMVSSPAEYAVTYDNSGKIDTVQFLPENDGKYILEYIFELSNNAGVDADNMAYKAQIFVDTNADGRYDLSEELDGLSVVNMNTGADVAYNRLETGVRYKVSRELPVGYIGMIPWKLQVTQVKKIGDYQDEATKVHTSVKGYTAVPAKDITKINVLYIKSAKRAGTSNTVLDFANSTFSGLLNNTKVKFKYDIKFTVVQVADYVKKYNNYLTANGLQDNEEGYTRFYNSYFNDYDMVMMGFTDMYEDITSNGATMALKLFIESGRSLLFSHDTTSFVNSTQTVYNNSGYTDYWGYYLNKNIRSIVGMDRYGVTENDLSFLKNGSEIDFTAEPEKKLAIEAVNKDVAYWAKSDKATSRVQVHGLNDYLLIASTASSKNTYGNVYVPSSYFGATTYTRLKAISQVNKGQITTFPYDINLDDSRAANVGSYTTGSSTYSVKNPATMEIKVTHYQYYQLDMNLDKTGDGKSDVVVWYCLADGVYDAIPNDVRNSYYIYSVGNVMYTGMGHSGNSVSLDESKLMINTIIASYKAGKRNPELSIIKDADSKGVIKEYAYRTYDDQVGMLDQENEDIYFYVNDNNIISGQKYINLKYYVEIEPAVGEVYDASNPTHVVATVGGEEVYLRELIYNSGNASLDEIIDPSFTIPNNSVGKITVKPKLLADRFAQDIGSAKIYVSAQTTLDYDGGKKDEKTGVVYACLTVKVRDLIDLD